jgi:hemin uptake protein HemP
MTIAMESGKPFEGDARLAPGAVSATVSGALAPTRPPTRITSHTLFGTATEVQIDHNGVLYRLRRTAAGKLILTK